MNGKRRSVSLSDILPRDLPSMLVEHSRIGLGYDIATTTKEKSNPSSLSVIEQVGMNFYARLIMRWKTADPDVAKAIIIGVLMLLAPRRPVRICIDASNEKYYAAGLKKSLQGMVLADLVTSSETTVYLGEKMSFKVYLGNLLVNALEDGLLSIPNLAWVKNDFRLVKRSGGSFETEVDESGNHGDTFDSVKLGLHALSAGGGMAEAEAARVGGSIGQGVGRILKNPFARLFEPGRKALC